MKTQLQQPQSVSRTIQNKAHAAYQASAQRVLQKYAAQRIEIPQEDDEPLQGKFENKTGLPNQLKSGVESLSGYSLDNVHVHYNSPKPAQLQALAYTQGTDIHVGPGQEKHLPHETWHVVQQMQGRVQPTMQMQGVNVNDNAGLEKEADVMGSKSNVLQFALKEPTYTGTSKAERVTLHLDKGDAVAKGSPPQHGEDPDGYGNLRTLGLTGLWIRFHVLNEHCGGKGIKKNLTSAKQQANKCKKWYSDFEVKEKGFIHDNGTVADNIIDFDATVNYHPSCTKTWEKGTRSVTIKSEDYPNNIEAELKVDNVREASSSIHESDGLIDPNNETSINGWTKK